MRRSSKLKKAGAAILTAVMTMSLLAGCSEKGGTETASQKTEATEESQAGGTKGEDLFWESTIRERMIPERRFICQIGLTATARCGKSLPQIWRKEELPWSWT